jgi:DnaJ-like protein
MAKHQPATMAVRWKKTRDSGRSFPARCFHPAGSSRIVPQVVRLDLGQEQPVFTVDVSIRECCLADPCVRVAWWSSARRRLADELPKYPHIDGAWLVQQLGQRVPPPTDEDRWVDQLIQKVTIRGRTSAARSAFYDALLRAAQHLACLNVSGGSNKDRTAGWPGGVEDAARRFVEDVLTPPLAAERSLLGLGPVFTEAELKTAYRAAVRQHHPDAGGSEVTMKEINAAYERLSKGG